jgi:anti-sigma B factor antagonist
MTVVTVTGAIDLATAPQLRSRLDAVPDRGTVVDLAGVTLLAAAGVTVLLGLQDRLARAGAQLVLLGVPPHVRRVLDATGLDTVLTMTLVIAEAVELAASPRYPDRDRPPIPHAAAFFRNAFADFATRAVPKATSPAVGDDTTSAAAMRKRGPFPPESPRNLRALPGPEPVDPHQIRPPDQPDPGDIA